MPTLLDRDSTIAIIDDPEMFREALRQLLDRTDDLRVVCASGDARTGFACIERSQPDVVLLDLGLPGMDGLTAARDLRDRAPYARIIMLSAHRDRHQVDEAFSIGVAAYLQKSESVEALLDAVRRVARGERLVPPDWKPRAQRRNVDGPLGALSARERDVFRLIVHGLSNQQIARELCVSPKTVETHREHILKKLRVHSIVELMRFASRHQLIEDGAAPRAG